MFSCSHTLAVHKNCDLKPMAIHWFSGWAEGSLGAQAVYERGVWDCAHIQLPENILVPPIHRLSLEKATTETTEHVINIQ